MGILQLNASCWLAFALAAAAAIAQEHPVTAKSAPDIARLIRELDHEEFGIREHAEKALIEAGPDVVPALRTAIEKGSAELRLRAKRVIARFEHVEHERRLAEFTRLSKLADDQIDVELGMCLISQIVDPQTTPAQVKKQLDELAAELGKKLPGKIAALEPREAMEAFHKALRDDLGFRGNVDDYQNPENSAVSKVLATRKGLPILLSHVAVSLARRLDLPVVGLGVSGRYVCKYDGERAPAGFAKTDYVLSLFDGKLATRAEFVREREEQGLETTAEELQAFPPKQALARMLRNLIYHAEHRGQPKQAELAHQFLLAVEPVEKDEQKP